MVISLLLLAGLMLLAGGFVAWHYLRPHALTTEPSATAKSARHLRHLKFNDADFFLPAWLITSINRSAFRKVRQINLAVPANWHRNMQPANFSEKSDLSQWILASINERSSFVSNSKWLNTIYRHYIAGPATSHASGLLRYRFKPNAPYSDVEIFTDDLKNPGVIIRCELVNTILPARLCENRLNLGSRFTVTYRFARARLADWHKMHQTVSSLINTAYKKRGI